jgi:LPXTG-motif cell wall-anchored protein
VAALGFGLIGVGLYSLPAAAEAVPTNQAAVVDGLADVLELHGAPLTLSRADITGATIEYAPTWIQAVVRTFSATDPVVDTDWQSDNTFIVWSLDTSGDGKVDYLVEYGITSDKELYGDVLRPDSGPAGPAVCDADSVTYSGGVAGGVYTLRLDPACLDHPPQIAYTVGISYDSGGGRGSGPVGTDIVPDHGFAAAVPAPVAPTVPPTGFAPQMLLPPPTSVAPQSAPDAGGAPPAVTPEVPAQATPGTTRRAATAAGPPRATPGTTRPPATSAGPGRRPANSPPPVGVAARAAVRELPRTGSQRLGSLSAVGFGIVLMGAGLLVMARPEEPDRAGSWMSASEM